MNPRTTRSLVLKRESLASLSTEELADVAGATGALGAGAALSRYDGKCTFDDSYIFCTASCYVAP